MAINGDVVGEYDSSPQSTFTAFDIQGSGVSTLTLTSVGLSDAEWLSLIEVRTARCSCTHNRDTRTSASEKYNGRVHLFSDTDQLFISRTYIDLLRKA